MKFPQCRLSYKSGQEKAQGLPGRLPPGQPLSLLLHPHPVRQQVGEKFNVWLQPEVRFIAENGEVNAEEVIA